MDAPTLIPLSLLAAVVLITQIVGIIRDADWWVITRDTARGHAEHVARTLRR